MLTRKICFIVALIILMVAAPSAADTTHIQTTVPTQICLPDKSQCIDIPEGHFVDKGSWDLLDTEKKQLQEKDTRLTAENESFRKSAKEVHWLPVAVGAALGVVLGVYVGHKI